MVAEAQTSPFNTNKKSKKETTSSDVETNVNICRIVHQ